MTNASVLSASAVSPAMAALCAGGVQLQRAAVAQPPDAQAWARACAGLADALAQHHEALRTGLLPALYEAVAGSDPVCIRALGQSLGERLVALAQQARGLAQRPPPWEGPAQDLQAACAQWTEDERRHLLSLAERLLDDTAWPAGWSAPGAPGGPSGLNGPSAPAAG